MRIFAYYILAFAVSLIYSGQVCPLMDALPVRELAGTMFWPLMVACGIRIFAQKRLVDEAPLLLQPGRQFQLDFGLLLLAGMGMATQLYFTYGFPLIRSGMKLVLGLVIMGLFAGLDMTLARERAIITKTIRQGGATRPPRKLSPMPRKFALIASLLLILMTGLLLLLLARYIHGLQIRELSPATIAMLGQNILLKIAFVMAVLTGLVVNLILSWARNLKMLFKNEIRVLERVSRGELNELVPVATNDEFGYIAGHTNRMIKTLRDGVRMQQGLRIAREVQRNFLPPHPPQIQGLSCAATSRSSDETGGDFYDWVECEDGCGRTVFMVGDVVGHGIGAALLMASARAMLRQSGGTLHGPANAVNAVNRSLSRDIRDSGRFLTLFMLEVEQAHQSMRWINAGHPPAQIYDSEHDTFTQLTGKDIPVGVDREWTYGEMNLEWLRTGQILIAGTDGIWEAPGPDGSRFGQERFQKAVRTNAKGDAQVILKAIMDTLDRFTKNTPQDDDITLLVIKAEA